MSTPAPVPSSVRTGLAVVCGGGLLDLVCHATDAPGSFADAGHVAVLAGMALTASGLLRTAAGRIPRIPPRNTRGGRR